MPRPYRTLGYPVVPLVFIIFTFLFVIVTLIEKPMHVLAGLMLILIALPIYYYFKKANTKELDSAHFDSG